MIATVDTRFGPFTVITTDDPADTADRADTADDAVPAVPTGPAVLASGWTDDPAALLPQVAPELRPDELRWVATIPGVTDAVVAYHDGEVTAIDDVVVLQRSGPFRSHAWDVLRTVPAGEPVTYTRYAELAGRPAAVRAAAGACASNAAALFVPCHRVLRSDGSLGGFRWGVDVKRRLLDHEAA